MDHIARTERLSSELATAKATIGHLSKQRDALLQAATQPPPRSPRTRSPHVAARAADPPPTSPSGTADWAPHGAADRDAGPTSASDALLGSYKGMLDVAALAIRRGEGATPAEDPDAFSAAHHEAFVVAVEERMRRAEERDADLRKGLQRLSRWTADEIYHEVRPRSSS